MIPGAEAFVRYQTFAEHGLVMIEHALTAGDLQRMGKAFAPKPKGRALPTTAGGVAVQRRGAISPSLRTWLSAHPVMQSIAGELSGEPLRLVRIVADEGSTSANWFVPWHQHRTIPLAEHFQSDEFGPWTLKDGGLHAEAPAELLERMVILRVYLDTCAESNAPMEALRGTHLQGRLEKSSIAEQIGNRVAALCLADRGDILAMRPLLLHRSRRALSPRRRRILHLEFGPAMLPQPARWGWDQIPPPHKH